MSRDNRRTAERLDIARERIAAERTARTGRLDLGNLGLTRPPPGLAELDWLEALNLGGVYESYGTVLRRSDAGEWEETDEAYNPNHIESILSALTKLPHLRHLDCFGAELHDLTPLAGCSALESLDCEDTQKSPIWRRWPAAPRCNPSTAQTPRSPIWRRWPNAPRCGNSTAGRPGSLISPRQSSNCLVWKDSSSRPSRSSATSRPRSCPKMNTTIACPDCGHIWPTSRPAGRRCGI